MRKADLVSAAVVVAFGLLLLFVIVPVWVQSHEEGGYGLGARVMPDIAATIVTALGAMFFISRLIRRREGTEAERHADAAPPIPRSGWLFLLRASVFLIAMTALFTWAGFLVAGPPTIAGFMIMMGERRPLPIVLTSVLAAGAIWLFFWKLLSFPLP